MARLTVRLISRGMADVLKFRGVGDELERRADRVARQARSSAPSVTGAYRSSIEVELDTHPTRVVAHVRAQVPYAQKVEARHRTLGMAIDAARG